MSRQSARWFRDLPLARKVLLIPGLTLCLMGCILGTAIFNARSNIQALEHLERDAILPARNAAYMSDRITLIHGRLFALLSKRVNESDPDGWARDADGVLRMLADQWKTLKGLEAELRGKASDAQLDQLVSNYQDYAVQASATIDAASTDRSYGALEMIGADDRFSALRSVFDQLVTQLRNHRSAVSETMIVRGRYTESVMIILGLAAAFLALFGSVAVGHGITQPILNLTAAIKSLVAGDTSMCAPGTGRKDEVGAIARAIEVFRINAIAQAEANAALRRTHWHLDVALNNMSQGLCLFGEDGALLLWNRRFHEVLGIPPDVIREGLSYRTLLVAGVAAGLQLDDTVDGTINRQFMAVSQGQSTRLDTALANGRHVRICRETLPEGGWVATIEDTTDKHRDEERIIYMARHDSLTGLPNRRLFQERLESALARAARGAHFAVLCLDLDHFKKVNDTLGHDTGDALLRLIAERLQACVRDIDTVARLGGDEFAILQENISGPENASLLAARILDVACGVVEVNGHQITTGTSIGIALAPSQGTSVGALLKNADVALYAAKAERGRYMYFDPGMAAHLHDRRAMEMDLRHAISRDELELYYQPLLALDREGEHVVAFEALIRWNHPERGMVSPGEFIPLAEETGMILPIGEWVLNTACNEATRWPADVKVAVNLSPVQFRGNRLERIIEQALERSGLRPGRLELEITESILLSDDEATLDTLHRVRDLGVGISMDDFGTGYSSLSYLHKFPFDKIKIDRSFIIDITRKEAGREVVRAITALSKGLGMTTVAEGVETNEQLRLLRLEGCTEVQGYLFSPPVPGSRIAAMLELMNGVPEKV